jgi:hypothetical protein
LETIGSLRRNEIVCERDGSRGYWPGRVWRRVDAEHVLVIDCGRMVTLYRDDQLMRSDYRGRWKWGRHPGNDRGLTPVWIPFSSLRLLKNDAKRHHPHFGGSSGHGVRWTRKEREEAIAGMTVYQPRKAA